MKKYLLIFLLLFGLLNLPLSAQEIKRSYAGLGIEAGVGYNTLSISLKSMAGGDSSVALNHLWMQPCIRIHYDIVLKPLGIKNTLKLKTFLGYYTFGGKLKPDAIGNSEVVSFGSIEAGAGPTFDIGGYLQISPLIKGQYIFSATERPIRATPTTTRNVKDITSNFAANAGLQIRGRIKHITIGGEAWIGLTNFRKGDDRSAKENNYRLLIGYEF